MLGAAELFGAQRELGHSLILIVDLVHEQIISPRQADSSSLSSPPGSAAFLRVVCLLHCIAERMNSFFSESICNGTRAHAFLYTLRTSGCIFWLNNLGDKSYPPFSLNFVPGAPQQF